MFSCEYSQPLFICVFILLLLLKFQEDLWRFQLDLSCFCKFFSCFQSPFPFSNKFCMTLWVLYSNFSLTVFKIIVLGLGSCPSLWFHLLACSYLLLLITFNLQMCILYFWVKPACLLFKFSKSWTHQIPWNAELCLGSCFHIVTWVFIWIQIAHFQNAVKAQQLDRI